MGNRLVIAEKPMLAKAILDAIPGTAKSIKAGERVFYTEKGDYLVVALTGCGCMAQRRCSSPVGASRNPIRASNLP